MGPFRSEVLDWLGGGLALPGRERDVLRVARVSPSLEEWRNFLGHLTLWLGTVALAAAVIFFFAFNWEDLGRFAKFGLVEAAILAGLLACWLVELDSMPGKAILVMLSLLTGALLALSGQIYQTGADTYELFAWWAVLILPWVSVGRFSPLWLIWLTLLNLSTWFYFSLWTSADPLLWSSFALNVVALILWEAAHRAGLAWLRDSWPPRLVSIAAGCGATALIVWAIFETDESAGMRALAALAYLSWLMAMYAWYRHVRPDLFMLAGSVLSLIVAVAVFLTHHILDTGSGAFLLIGLVVIGMSAGGAIWLKSVARKQSA